MKLPSSIENLASEVPHNSTRRFNCPNPLCNGFNSLGITKENGKVKWNCFKCGKVSGDTRYSRTISELKSQLELQGSVKKDFELPDYLVYGLSSPKSVLMINKGHCLEPYTQGLFDVAYDPVEDRFCFIVKRDNKVIGLVGKSFKRDVYPKVLNYEGSDNTYPFIVGTGKTVVLVEDCLSAASAARLKDVSGLALLGKAVKSEYIPLLRKYDKVIVALDRDARKKALANQKKLCYYHPKVEIWLLDKDIKDMNDSEIGESYHGRQ